jgi:GPH family glycoside/pentoside/hexuronide:cation symporter
MNGGITKLAFSMQGVLFASVMSTAGYVAGEAVQNASAIMGIRFLISGTPILACLVIAFCMSRYPLGRDTFKKGELK